MTLSVYFSIALLVMETDALLCYISGTRYRWMASLICALIWPVSALLVIRAMSVEEFFTTENTEGTEGRGR